MDFPARVHVLLASEAPVGVALRRGPAKSVCSVLWDRRKDEFMLGQWFRGRIYELRCDISPDGRHMIYFAFNGNASAETRGSWTAISQVPWLKAAIFFDKGDCWQGGGLFTSTSRYWLNGCHPFENFAIQDYADLRPDSTFQPSGDYGFECPGIYYVKLQRDGWLLKERLSAGPQDRVAVFESLCGMAGFCENTRTLRSARRRARPVTGTSTNSRTRTADSACHSRDGNGRTSTGRH